MSTRRLIVFQVLVIVVLAVAGFVGYYEYYQATNYVKTDNAQVTGQQIVIAAPVSGKLASWNGAVDKPFNSWDTVGEVQTETAKGLANVAVADPAASTVVANMAVNGEVVAAGTPLAYAYDLNNLWVTANIKETDIDHVKVGQSVDVYLEAYPGTTYSGVVKAIGDTTTATLSPLPSGSTNANYTKVTQVIPVTIQLQSQTDNLKPGMNASVRIHR